MAVIKRCDICEGLSDTVKAGEHRVYGIGSCHNLMIIEDRDRISFRISHPSHDLCIECLKQLITRASLRSVDDKVEED